jgi:hypothetical protein
MKALHRLSWPLSFLLAFALVATLAAPSWADPAPAPTVNTTHIVDYNLQEWGITGSYPFTYSATQEGATMIEVRNESGRVIVRLDRAQIEAYRRFDALLKAKLLARSPLGSARVRGTAPLQARRPTTQTPCVEDPFSPFVQPFQTIWNSQVTVSGSWR